MITPEGETFESMTSRPPAGVPGSKSRLPLPRMTGNVQTLNSSISPSACSDWMRSALPWTWMSGPSCALTALTASASGPSSSCEFCHSTDFSVVEATYLVGEDLVGLAAEQEIERVGHGRVHGLVHDVVPVAERPAAVLEAAVGVLFRRAGGLHDAVERHERVHDELAHVG